MILLSKCQSQSTQNHNYNIKNSNCPSLLHLNSNVFGTNNNNKNNNFDDNSHSGNNKDYKIECGCFDRHLREANRRSLMIYDNKNNYYVSGHTSRQNVFLVIYLKLNLHITMWSLWCL